MRSKEVDPHLVRFIAERGATIAAIDLSCGTGNQLVANAQAYPDLRLVGLDFSIGMLNQARTKMAALPWIHGDATDLPFRDAAFDYASNQFAFHHVIDKAQMLREVFRLLRVGGRFVIQNIEPHSMQDAQLYRYFPTVLTADLRDFAASKKIETMLRQAGFAEVAITVNKHHTEKRRSDLLNAWHRREDCSQLTAITDAEYAAGLAALERDIANAETDPVLDETSFLTIIADKA